MIGKFGIPELLIVFGIAVLIFGPSKLAGLGKSLGDGIRQFKSAVDGDSQQPSHSVSEDGKRADV